MKLDFSSTKTAPPSKSTSRKCWIFQDFSPHVTSKNCCHGTTEIEYLLKGFAVTNQPGPLNNQFLKWMTLLISNHFPLKGLGTMIQLKLLWLKHGLALGYQVGWFRFNPFPCHLAPKVKQSFVNGFFLGQTILNFGSETAQHVLIGFFGSGGDSPKSSLILYRNP